MINSLFIDFEFLTNNMMDITTNLKLQTLIRPMNNAHLEYMCVIHGEFCKCIYHKHLIALIEEKKTNIETSTIMLRNQIRYDIQPLTLPTLCLLFFSVIDHNLCGKLDY